MENEFQDNNEEKLDINNYERIKGTRLEADEYQKVCLNDYYDCLIDDGLSSNNKALSETSKSSFPATPYNYFLRKAIAERFHTSPEKILTGNNPWELIENVITALSPDVVSYVIPVSSMYRNLFESLKVRSVEIPMNENLTLPMYRIIQMNSSVTFIQNPNNPMGIAFDYSTLNNIIENVSGIVLIDEIFGNFMPDTFIDDVDSGKVIVLKSFCGYGIPGAFPCFLVATEEIISKIKKARFPFTFSSASEEITLACFSDRDFFEKSRRTVNEQRALMSGSLRSLGFEIIDSKTNFILVKRENAIKIGEYLLKNNCYIRTFPEEFWLNEYIRIPVRQENENKKLIELITKAVSQV